MQKNEIFVIYGNRPGQMVDTLLAKIDILHELPFDKPILIKPNLVVSKPSDSGATTDPEIVSAVIAYLQAHRFRNLVIMESSWIGDRTETAFQVCGYEDISRRFGIPLVDLSHDRAIRVGQGASSFEVCERATEVGYIVNIPVLKAHCQTKLTCALKNLKGLIPDREKRRFHAKGLHRPIAELNRFLRTDLVIVDGIVGDLTNEEGGNPVRMNRIIAGKDPVLVDAYAATLLGYHPREIDYISIAEEIGVGSADLSAVEIHEIGSAEGSGFDLPRGDRVERLSGYAMQDQACSACFGSLIHALDRLSETRSFPFPSERIKVGQGFKETAGQGIGVGRCTRGLERFLPGCPPSALEILEFLKSHWRL